jgi:long-chain acyl-CoA synthetase
MLLFDTLFNSAKAAPQSTAILFRDERISYAELEQRVRRLASAMRALGVRRGNRVAILLDNSPEFVTSYFAGLLAGAILVPTNTFLVNPEIDYIYRDAEISLLVTSGRFAERLSPVLKNFDRLRAVLVSGGEGAGENDTSWRMRFSRANWPCCSTPRALRDNPRG